MTAKLEGEILRVLADGKFHAAEEIAALLGVGRSSVLHALSEQAALRLPVFRVRGRGYRLAHGYDVLSSDTIQKTLAGSLFAAHVEVISHLESTNAYLMQKAIAGAPHGSSVFAEFQSHGRGRRGRSWEMGWGEGLAFSLLWRFEQGAAGLSGLSLAVGVALVRGLENFGASGVELKWPNDLIYSGRKLGGILIELHGDADGPCAAVIGIGINIRRPREVGQPVADLRDVGFDGVDRNALAAVLLLALESTLQVFSQSGFAPLQDEWLRHHAYNDRTLCLVSGTGSIEGRFAGLAEDGALLLETKQGRQRFTVGDVSLRAEPSRDGLVE